ncbi:hypothetical protein Asppvi_009331 [Aspergillus pseudoviridinutans]|uniref:SGNH hydrolase-type esterase domain-containing protein n=1 Tax=Aspergillus pseudoviridinutans TaxID=1517512 RepID=A0A9P3BFI7_9EURO|nr:uncharacterized protein Asppvi_009331 [Aspergillus pseudoviridinutans]GIJ90377.1 hypothetical protein Asppvi_009331 [Aspergillus pseudoviridinutans]
MLGGLDWQFSNVTANSTYQFIGDWTAALNATAIEERKSFELRAGVSVASDAKIYKAEEYPKVVEIIGDSLSIGQYATYEGLSSWAYNFAAGFGDVEYSITVRDLDDSILPSDQTQDEVNIYQRHTLGSASMIRNAGEIPTVSSPRAKQIYGTSPPKWDFGAHRPADLVIINLGANDNLTVNNVSSLDFQKSYVEFINGIHHVWPSAQIILMSLWGDFIPSRMTYTQTPQYVEEIENVYRHFDEAPEKFVYYFDTTGILQHNDIAQESHLTDVGNVKIASHLNRWVAMKFGWRMQATGSEILHGTMYWNDESRY